MRNQDIVRRVVPIFAIGDSGLHLSRNLFLGPPQTTRESPRDVANGRRSMLLLPDAQAILMRAKEKSMKAMLGAPFLLGICAAASVLAGCGGVFSSPSFWSPHAQSNAQNRSVSSVAAVAEASCQGQQGF